MKTNRTTPKYVIDKMWNIIMLHVFSKASTSKLNVLEPSAGEGNLVLYQLSNLLFDFTCVELNKDKYDELNKICSNSIHGDFMKLDFEQNFDIVVAAPPFNNNIDVEHIKKMYSLLKENGIRESKDVTFIDYIPIIVLVVGLICSISIIFYL